MKGVAKTARGEPPHPKPPRRFLTSRAETTQDVRKDLQDNMLKRFKAFAEETAAAPDVSKEHKQMLVIAVDQLCGSKAWSGSVMCLIDEIIADHEAFRLWLVDAFPRLSPEDQAALTLRLRPFVPGSAVHLRGALYAAFTIGVFTRNPIQKLREMRQGMAHARKERHPGSDEKKAKIAKRYEQGMNAVEIAQQLGLNKDTVSKSIRRMIKAGELQETQPPVMNKKKRTSD